MGYLLREPPEDKQLCRKSEAIFFEGTTRRQTFEETTRRQTIGRGKRGEGGDLEIFGEGAAAAVLAVGEVLPLHADAVVAFEFEVAFCFFESFFVEDGYKVGKYEGVDAFVHVFFLDGDEQEVDDIVFAMDALGEVVPSGGEQFAFCLAGRGGEGGHTDAESHEVVVGIDDDADAVEAQDAEIGFYIIVDLALIEGGVAIEFIVGFVDEIE